MKIILEVKSEWKNFFDLKMVIFGSFYPKRSENGHFRIKKSIFYWKFQKLLTANYFTDIYCELFTESFILLLTANFSEKFTDSVIFNLVLYCLFLHRHRTITGFEVGGHWFSELSSLSRI